MQNESTPSIDMLIRAAITETPTAPTADIASTVIDRIEPGQYAKHLRELIAGRVSSVSSDMRVRVTPNIQRGVSTKQSLIRDDYWPEFLSQRIAVPGGYKTLAEATPDDLRFNAAERRAQAAELSMRAEQFETLADLMVSARVKQLSQLDRAQAARVLEQAA